MSVIHAADAQVHELHGARFSSYAAPSRGTSAQLCSWRVDVPAGTTGVPHVISREEVFLVLEGVMRLVIDGEPEQLHTGDVAVAPASARLQVDNAGPGAAAAWVTTSAGLEAVLPDGSRVNPPWAQ